MVELNVESSADDEISWDLLLQQDKKSIHVVSYQGAFAVHHRHQKLELSQQLRHRLHLLQRHQLQQQLLEVA